MNVRVRREQKFATSERFKFTVYGMDRTRYLILRIWRVFGQLASRELCGVKHLLRLLIHGLAAPVKAAFQIECRCTHIARSACGFLLAHQRHGTAATMGGFDAMVTGQRVMGTGECPFENIDGVELISLNGRCQPSQFFDRIIEKNFTLRRRSCSFKCQEGLRGTKFVGRCPHIAGKESVSCPFKMVAWFVDESIKYVLIDRDRNGWLLR